MASDPTPFIPGFETRETAAAAGRKFFERTNGQPGVEGRDFHLTQNRHGRWHFEHGKGPDGILAPSSHGRG